MISLYLFEAICLMIDFISFENDYHLLFAFLGFLIQACIAKWLSTGLFLASPLTINDCIQQIKDLTSVCTTKNKENSTKIFILVNAHRNICCKAGCLCHDDDVKNIRDDTNLIQPNSKVFTVKEEVPIIYKEGFFIKSLKILTDDLANLFPCNDEIEMLIAELNFYYFGNHYYSLEKLWPILGRNPSIFMKQRIYNLKRNINKGLEFNYAMMVDREKTVDSIDYMESYRHFLDKSEDLIDLTIKFWSYLSQERPTSRELNKIGNELFKTKQKILTFVSEISKFSNNNFDFLLRYGLLLKSAMHDNTTAEQIFFKLAYMNSSAQKSSENSKFSVFSNKSVMFLVAAFTENDDANVIQINTEFERVTGYQYHEIMNHSICILMPSLIANVHSKFIQKFFQTMDGKVIGVPVSVFLKCKNGLFIPCRVMVKMVPRMAKGLQAAVFIVKDAKMTQYTMFNSNKKLCNNKYGAIVCDASNSKIIGITKEAISILKLSGQNLNEMIRNNTFEDFFPNICNESVKNSLSKKEGQIIKRTVEIVDLEDENLQKIKEESEPTFLWVRLITAIYTEQVKLSILVISEINKKYSNLLSPLPDNSFLCQNTSSVSMLDKNDNSCLNKSSINIDKKQPLINAEHDLHIDSESAHLFAGDDYVSSCSASSESKNRTTESDSEGNNNIFYQTELVSKMPSSIKKLSFGIGLALVGIIVLISIF